MRNGGQIDDINLIGTDVLIVGAGAAGLRAAIELAREGVGVLVLGKRRHGDAHTVWAAGGINASLGNLDPDDRWEIHAADTIGEGHFVNDPRAVEILAREAPERILELRDWGCPFSLTKDGELNQRYFGAQSFRRTCFAGDTTGEAILGTLVDKAKEVGVSYREDVYVTKLLKSGGRVNGAAGFDMRSGRRLLFGARAVVLAAGGYTSIYRRGSSRPDENNGDAMALAYEAGAALKDMEFVQFHPTGMIEPEEMDGRLVTEAVRGEGGRLYNSEGERFMERYSPRHMELDARDVVARANYREIRDGRGTPDGAVLLDISHRDPGLHQGPAAEHVRAVYGAGGGHNEGAHEGFPTAHYGMGGIEVDPRTGATAVEGLFAVGESTAGVHGANRLGGNSLAETVVFGKILGSHLADVPGRPVAARPARRGRGARALRGPRRPRRRNRGGERDPESSSTSCATSSGSTPASCAPAKACARGLAKLRDLKERAGKLAISDDARAGGSSTLSTCGPC
jgi:succinate dehydrogenase / fumarate reductase flavoprotein subunit